MNKNPKTETGEPESAGPQVSTGRLMLGLFGVLFGGYLFWTSIMG